MNTRILELETESSMENTSGPELEFWNETSLRGSEIIQI